MTNEQLTTIVNNLSDGASALIIADMVINNNTPTINKLFLTKVLTKCSEGHHQIREFALAGLKVLHGE